MFQEKVWYYFGNKKVGYRLNFEYSNPPRPPLMLTLLALLVVSCTAVDHETASGLRSHRKGSENATSVSKGSPFQSVGVGGADAPVGHEYAYERSHKSKFVGGGPRPCLNPVARVHDADDVTEKKPVSKKWCHKTFTKFDSD
eukprot:1352282-Amorphochlora_amoeboformis.AAC.1